MLLVKAQPNACQHIAAGASKHIATLEQKQLKV
jgi:hypothetical protein